MVVMVPILAISPWPWGVLSARVAHVGLRMVAVIPILAISPWPCAALSARVAHAGLRMVVTVPILAISPWPCGRAYSVCISRGVFIGAVENVETIPQIAETDLRVSRSRH